MSNSFNFFVLLKAPKYVLWAFAVMYLSHGENDTEIIITWYFVVTISVSWEKWHRDHYYLVFCCAVSVPWGKWQRSLLPGILLLQNRYHGKKWYRYHYYLVFCCAVSVPWENVIDNYYLVFCCAVSVPWEKWHRDNYYLVFCSCCIGAMWKII